MCRHDSEPTERCFKELKPRSRSQRANVNNPSQILRKKIKCNLSNPKKSHFKALRSNKSNQRPKEDPEGGFVEVYSYFLKRSNQVRMPLRNALCHRWYACVHGHTESVAHSALTLLPMFAICILFRRAKSNRKSEFSPKTCRTNLGILSRETLSTKLIAN